MTTSILEALIQLFALFAAGRGKESIPLPIFPWEVNDSRTYVETMENSNIRMVGLGRYLRTFRSLNSKDLFIAVIFND